MTYQRSAPLDRWLNDRRQTIDAVASGHAAVGEVTGPRRPLALSRPLAHAYVIVMLREFQAFVRDLHDLAVQVVVFQSVAAARFRPLLIGGLTSGRSLDRGNATQAVIKADFKRIGLTPIDIGAHDHRWSAKGSPDSSTFEVLVQLRNALGHGNEVDLNRLTTSGEAKDTISWARRRRPVLNRYARALDKVVWDHLETTIGREPW